MLSNDAAREELARLIAIQAGRTSAVSSEVDLAHELEVRLAAELESGAARDELIAIEREYKRRRWAQDPVAWTQERLSEHIWSKQKEVLLSVRDHSETIVKTCHEVGKSYIAARAIGWWLDSHKPGEAAVVTTAPTNRQVKAILWKEIGRVQAKGLRGRVNQKEWYVSIKNRETGIEREEMVAFGFKPADYDPTAFQGIHERFLLIVVDEACGVKGAELWNAFLSLGANDNARLLLLGNPDFADGEFYDHCKPGSGANVIQVGAFDTPAFTGEPVPPVLLEHLIGRTYVEKMRKKWAPKWRWVDADGKPSDAKTGVRVVPPVGDTDPPNPFWSSKVLGEFPTHSDPLALLPVQWVLAAMQRELEISDTDVDEFGVDVGGGGDSSTVCHRQGPRFRIIHEDHDPDTMRTCGKVIALKKAVGRKVRVKVDKIGIGKGMFDRSHELSREGYLDEPFIGINVGEAASNAEEFENQRSEFAWALRDRFESGDIDLDPLDEDTAAELCSIRFGRTSRGRIALESKKEAKRRGVPSPNRADAVILANAKPFEARVLSGGLLA